MHRLYLVPTLLINVVIILIPALLTIALAFFRWDGIGLPVFIGLGNFENLWEDRTFWTAVTNNLIWTLIFMTVPIAMGLLAFRYIAQTAPQLNDLIARAEQLRSN